MKPVAKNPEERKGQKADQEEGQILIQSVKGLFDLYRKSRHILIEEFPHAGYQNNQNQKCRNPAYLDREKMIKTDSPQVLGNPIDGD